MFRERITRQYQSLSPSFRRIADLILTSHERAAFMSASRLARHVGVDVATVTRFSQQLGYEGFVELIREIQGAVLEEMRESRAPVQERQETAPNPVARMLWRDWANLEKTIQQLPLDKAEEAAELLRTARRVYIVSEDAAAGLSAATQSYLSMIRRGVIALDHGPYNVALALKEVGPEDVIVALGFSDYALTATRALALGKKMGARTIGIIAQADCPIAGEAELLLSCAATEEGYLPSPTAMASILFALSYSLYASNTDAYGRERAQFEEVYADLTNGRPREEEQLEEG
ncbi:MAG: MurR/RpiR family transcriptional regulator [Chloroflexi bacterium]|nr:MAG: MurR/RpiR family transcriptional regulator [Chloroflexota bacterium]